LVNRAVIVSVRLGVLSVVERDGCFVADVVYCANKIQINAGCSHLNPIMIHAAVNMQYVL